MGEVRRVYVRVFVCEHLSKEYLHSTDPTSFQNWLVRQWPPPRPIPSA